VLPLCRHFLSKYRVSLVDIRSGLSFLTARAREKGKLFLDARLVVRRCRIRYQPRRTMRLLLDLCN
jgi:hypothetical protein